MEDRLVSRRTLITTLALAAGGALVPVPAQAQSPRRMFIDMNDNGVFDAGDVLITDFETTGVVETDFPVVLPYGAAVTLRETPARIDCQKLTVLGRLTAYPDPLRIRTAASIVIGYGGIVAASRMQATAGRDLTTDLYGRIISYDTVMLETLSGRMRLAGPIAARERCELNVFGGHPSILELPGTVITVSSGILNLHVEGQVNAERAKLAGHDVTITAYDAARIVGPASRIRSTKAAGAIFISLSASTVADPTRLDLTGTVLSVVGGPPPAVDADFIVLTADEIVGYTA